MQRTAVVLVLLLVVGSVGAAIAQCGGASCPGCPDNCPGHGQTMTSVSGKITWVCPKHQGIKVKSGDKTLLLRVNPNCQSKGTLSDQVAKLKVGDRFTGTYYKLNNKLYLCKIGGGCSGGSGCH